MLAVPDPDLEMGGGWSSSPFDKGGGAVSKKTIIQPFRPQFGLKIGGGPRPLWPLPWLRHWLVQLCTVYHIK